MKTTMASSRESATGKDNPMRPSTVFFSLALVLSIVYFWHNSGHYPLLPTVVVGSTSAASITLLPQATATVAATAVDVKILVRNHNARPLSFSHVTLSAGEQAAVSHAPPFEQEGMSSSVLAFRLDNVTAEVGPAGTPSLRLVFGASVRFCAVTWPWSSEKIHMTATCSPATISFNVNNKNNNNSAGDSTVAVTAEEAAEIVNSGGGCVANGPWTSASDKNLWKIFVWTINIALIFSASVILSGIITDTENKKN